MRKGIITLALLAALVFAGTSAASTSNRTSRAQAVRSAKEYLQVGPFSLKGLAGQLQFSGFSRSDSLYGAKHSGANWMRQAVKDARSYLQMEAFSFSAMVQQLQFDKFTHRQAVHGARRVGL